MQRFLHTDPLDVRSYPLGLLADMLRVEADCHLLFTFDENPEGLTTVRRH